MINKKIIIASRNSNLAKTQTELVVSKLKHAGYKNIENYGGWSQRTFTIFFILSILVGIIGIVMGFIGISSKSIIKKLQGKIILITGFISLFLGLGNLIF